MQRTLGRIAAISLIVLSIAVLSLGAYAQAVPQDRIVQLVDDSVLTKLKGDVHPLARAEYNLGSAPASLPMNHMQFLLQRSPAQEAALEAYLTSVQVQGSPTYHKWLTPQEFGKLYGPSDSDVQKLTGWLEGQGFTVNRVSNGRTAIDFSGSAGEVQSAFHTPIDLYQANGVSFRANTSDPSIPSALAPVVSGIAHLNNVPIKPTLARGTPAKYDGTQHRFVPVTGATGARPLYTVGDAADGFNLFVVPADAATIYDTPNSLNSKFSGTASYTGTGVTIGIAGQSAIDPTLVQNYRNLFVGDTKAPVISNLDGVGDIPGDDGESYLDLEVSGGLAPGATTHFYTASATVDNGVITAAEYAIDVDNTIDILSLSYGACELFLTNAENAELNADWQQAAAQGITVVVSTGDTGSVSCDAFDESGTQSAQGPLSVSGFASTPYNIAVGGTDYNVFYTPLGSNNFSKYVSTSNPGTAANFYRTALGYIPEATWNDSTYPNLAVTNNQPISIALGNPQADNISAGSGGPSSCATNSTAGSTIGTCTAGYAKPSWQMGITGNPNDQVRDIPDVSLLAGNGLYGALWALCDGSATGNDSAGNTGTANCELTSTGDFYTDGVGGTSASTPAFAGMLALVVQKTGQRQGQAAPILYGLFKSSPSVFHDVTTGNNSVGCTQTGSTVATCVANSTGFFFESGYNTFTGYDLATGLGSVDATLMVNNWTSAAGSLSVANVAATPSSTSITTNEPLTFTINVTPLTAGGPTPAGTATVTDGVYTSPPMTLASGAATITIPANSLKANPADIFTVSYAPSTSGATFAQASTFVTVAITQAATPAIAISGASITVLEGASGSSTISVTPSGGFTGAVNLTCTVTGPAGATSLPTCSLTPSAVTIAGTAASMSTLGVVTTATTTVGAYTVTVNGADAATGKVTATAAISLTVNSATTPSLGVSGTPITITLPATTGTSTVTVTPGGGFTGAVNLTCAITSPAGATCSFSPSSVTISGTASATSMLTVTVLGTSAVGSAYTVSATATSATGNVTGTDSNISLTVGGTPTTETISFTPAPTTATVASPGQNGTSTLSVTANYVGGMINFGFVLASAPSNASTTYNPACTAPALTTKNGVATATATCTTTAPTTGALAYPKTHDKTNRWYEGAGGAALACILFFGIPARRRGWKSMLGLLVVLVTMAGVGCGGGGGGGGGGGTSGTTPGTYTYTVTGTDAATAATTATATVTVTVQ